MTFDLARILERKHQHRRALAALPIREKLRLLNKVRQRTLDLRSSEPTTSLILHQEPAVYSQLKSFTKIARHLAENFPDTTVFPAPPPRPSSHERPIPQF
jgi:hypothetical protein